MRDQKGFTSVMFDHEIVESFCHWERIFRSVLFEIVGVRRVASGFVSRDIAETADKEQNLGQHICFLVKLIEKVRKRAREKVRLTVERIGACSMVDCSRVLFA